MMAKVVHWEAANGRGRQSDSSPSEEFVALRATRRPLRPSHDVRPVRRRDAPGTGLRKLRAVDRVVPPVLVRHRTLARAADRHLHGHVGRSNCPAQARHVGLRV